VLKRKFKRAINIPDRSTITRLHLIWIATVCGKLKADFRYSNTLGGRTFLIPTLTDQNKQERGAPKTSSSPANNTSPPRFPTGGFTNADMYDPDRMDSKYPLVREAHDRNDEILERIYIGRRFALNRQRVTPNASKNCLNRIQK
jgi:hypothetical protein